MDVKYGEGNTRYGPGISIDMTGVEIVIAIEAYLVERGVYIGGSRTITVNGELCGSGHVYVDPSGFVVYNGETMFGRGPSQQPEQELRNLVDGEYESLAGISKKDFWDWSSGLVDGLAKRISDKIYKEYF